ncbi:hypothetical protein HUW46_07326 [Amycolatopsis sp. CA-230715]|nr:hypothetical protein HUW46_07326 [Amycolatopsis sp. CA-230715]
MLDLTTGSALILNGAEWIVERVEPQIGRVVLTAADGRRMPVTTRFLLHHSDCRPSTRTGASTSAGRGRQEPTLHDVTEHQRDLIGLRLAHLLEVETGFRSGDPARAVPGEPRPGYDPARTTVTQRRHAKVAELAALDSAQASLLGLSKVGYRTLIRWENRRRQVGPLGCADDRWLRPAGGHPSVSDRVHEAIHVVQAESLHRSRMSLRTKQRLIHQYIREQHGAEATAEIPCYETLRLVWWEWFGPGGGRQRYVRSAAKPTSGQHVVIHGWRVRERGRACVCGVRRW